MQRNWNYQPGPNHFQNMYPPQFPFQNQGSFHGMKSPYEQFQKPPMPMGKYPMNQGGGPMGGPYPKGPNPLLQAFQDQNGQMDFDKVFSTVGQVVNTVHQVQPLVKQVGSMIKGFKV
ncbi:YppG family protein [Salinibacillus xinjiangensis]|uniref:Spore coat protein n=1 Tax=Salinibacillus xinjiangensis TaxID=1229268 RepID=A0A6G1X8F6_9BACI|nr:YppG family protein [Salinibacillus xinjiangensis]MRG87227.1 hypothetical protein [Salinibacillus xinjiangensis]